MESWVYAFEGKSFSISDDMDIPVDAFPRSRKAFTEWDTKSSSNFENYGLLSDRVEIEGMELMEVGFPETTRKSFLSDPGVGISGGVVGHYSDRRVMVSPTCLIPSNPSFGGEELGLKFLGSPAESNSQESSLIDLKLGRLDDSKYAQNNELLKDYPMLSSAGSDFPRKRSRTISPYSQTPFCQVLGCNMDLSSSKNYHKRHRVCDVHSKTAKVIVNGIEQRFCQQCSRFHLVADFDDCKRSCRKRLAGHNARRRKPQLDRCYSLPHKLLEPYQGTGYQGTSLPERASFVFSDILSDGILHLDKYEQTNQERHIKLEELIYSPHIETPMKYSPLVAKSFPNVQDLSGASNSSCALSLLSAQSQEFQSNMAGTPKASSLIIPSAYAHQNAGHIAEKLARSNSMKQFAANGFWSSDMNSMEVYYQKGSIMLSDTSHAVDFEDHAGGIFQRSDFLDAKYCLSPEHGTTVDLIQLSSHLQRIEQQKDFLQG